VPPNVIVFDDCPCASVVVVLVANVPFTAVHVTDTPLTGPPASSVTRTTKGAPNGCIARPTWPLPDTAAIADGADVTAVAVNVAVPTPLAVAVTVSVPTVAPSV
jgi:hypothetical protein